MGYFFLMNDAVPVKKHLVNAELFGSKDIYDKVISNHDAFILSRMYCAEGMVKDFRPRFVMADIF